MTIPEERRWAIAKARRFLWDLMDPKKWPRVPRAVRREAAARLRHYPNEYEMHDVVRAFGDPPEPKRPNEEIL
jgi:hypothetical protein